MACNAPGASRLSRDQLRNIHAAKLGGVPGWEELATAYAPDMTPKQVKDCFLRAKWGTALAAALADEVEAVAAEVAAESPRPTGERVRWTGMVDGAASIESPKSSRIKTLDDLLASAEVDLERWEVDHFLVNAWEVGANLDGRIITEPLFQVKAWIKPRKDINAAREIIAGLIADMGTHAPVYGVPARIQSLTGAKRMAIISMADHHIGSLCWQPESGESYDVDIAERLADQAMESVLASLDAYAPEEITITLGHDFFHTDRTIDGKSGTTTRGTIQETDGRWQKTWRIGTRVAVRMIDAARERARVNTIVRPGNHDEQSAFMLGDLIDAWYRNDDEVTVNNSPAPRTYQRYGASMIGHTHGHYEKIDRLPMLMATEARQDWAETTWQDWLCGHLHRTGVVLYEDSCVQIHTAPSLCAADSWANQKGFRHRRSCMAFVYDYHDGPIAQLVFNAPPAQSDRERLN